MRAAATNASFSALAFAGLLPPVQLSSTLVAGALKHSHVRYAMTCAALATLLKCYVRPSGHPLACSAMDECKCDLLQRALAACLVWHITIL